MKALHTTCSAVKATSSCLSEQLVSLPERNPLRVPICVARPHEQCGRMHSAKLPFQTLHPDCMPKTQSLQKGKKQSTTTAEGAGTSLDFPELPQHVKPPVCSGPRPEAGILQSSLKGSPHRSPAMLRPVTLKISLGEYNSLSHPHHDGTMASKSSLMRIGQNKTLQLVRDCYGCYGYDMSTAWRRSRSA